MSGYLDLVCDVSLRWTASCQHLTTRLGTHVCTILSYILLIYSVYCSRVFSVLLTGTKLAPSRYSVRIW